MANASNNGLLPLNPQNGQQGYSQVSPMFGNYYNVAQAPSGNNVLGYNYGASGMMPGGVSGSGTSATPTPPTGGSLSLGSGNSNSSGGTPSPTPKSAGPYSATATGGAGNYGGYSANAIKAQGPAPVATPNQQPNIASHPLYNPAGALAAPNAHPIPAQVQANSSGQMQGASRPVNNPTAYSDWQAYTNPVRPPGIPVHPGPPSNGTPSPPMQGGNPPTQGGGNPVQQPPFGQPIKEQPAPPPPKPKPTPPPKKPAPPPKKPKPGAPPSAIDKWLAGDTTYQQQLAEYNQEQQAYNTNYTNTKDQIDQNFNSTQRSMNNQAALDRMNQQYDFAGRGVLSSGAYAQALDQYNTQFQNNIGNLVQGENQQLTANQTNLNNFLRQLTLQRNAAKQDAIARRAAQLGITS